mmetsp:Transcript_23511/g.61843  ORF Transcript_23511/g.61843 Transcript_23511/m.61843 type:complete len:100 (+) Transcript_23511:71-370(+)
MSFKSAGSALECTLSNVQTGDLCRSPAIHCNWAENKQRPSKKLDSAREIMIQEYEEGTPENISGQVWSARKNVAHNPRQSYAHALHRNTQRPSASGKCR